MKSSYRLYATCYNMSWPTISTMDYWSGGKTHSSKNRFWEKSSSEVKVIDGKCHPLHIQHIHTTKYFSTTEISTKPPKTIKYKEVAIRKAFLIRSVSARTAPSLWTWQASSTLSSIETCVNVTFNYSIILNFY